MLLDIAIIVFLMVAAILLILAEIFLLPGITLAGIGGAIFAIGGVVFASTLIPLIRALPIGAKRESVIPSSPGSIPRSLLDISLESISVFKAILLKDRERNNQAKIIPNVMIDKDKVRCPTHIPTV